MMIIMVVIVMMVIDEGETGWTLNVADDANDNDGDDDNDA